MKSKKIIYWVTTVLVGGMMIFSGISYLTDANMQAAFEHIGFPDFFRLELGIAKVLGALILLIPAVPANVK
jgi:hypothetical protein